MGLTVAPALVSLGAVEAAADRIAGQVVRTPMIAAPALSERAGCELLLKAENLQVTGSFKPRGAINTLAQLTPEERARGVVAVSAGNHAQGVAYAARRLGVPALVLMPESAPAVKVDRTRALGADVMIVGATFDDAAAALPAVLAKSGATLIHPFDDDRVIAGQGTVALEMIADVGGLDVVVVAIGGGGLLSGMAVVLRALSPRTEVIGVQGDHYPAMAKAVGRWPGHVPGGATIAEGMASRTVSARTAAHVAALVDDILIVSESQIAAALACLVRETRLVVEGAAAATLAAMFAHSARFAGRRVGLVLCGGNIDDARLCALLAAPGGTY
ncbi:pyridoxal-phosphate dependent enzyme [Sphingomonas sp.]|uniref:pyridoxal-phosphate dependent enzyme n=1 Tax=Sphingomonas sp. TaxID=28214 RepID=UPI0025E6B7AF|nr:pyridoxal-phosphate dependent enzyme [Sphingomonas sp.]